MPALANTSPLKPSAETLRDFDAFARVLSHALILVASDDTICAANPAAGKLLGVAPGTIVGRRLQQLTSTESLDFDALLRTWRRTSSPTSAFLSFVDERGDLLRCRVEGGRLTLGAAETGNVLLRLMPVDKSTSRFVLLNRQITELKSEVSRRRRAEERLEGQNKLLASIAGGQDLPTVLDAIVRFVETRSKRALCSILLLDEDQKLRLGAAQSLPAAYNRAIDCLPIGPNVGSCGSAAFHRRPVIVRDIATDPRWADFRELALSHNLRACWSTPLIGRESRVLGTVAMYYEAPGEPSSDDLDLTAVARDLAIIAIERHHSDKTLRQRAEQLLEADQRKDRFLAMLSHELRNPLAPIMSSVEVLAERLREDSKSLEMVARLQRQTGQLCRLVDDLLDVSRIAHDIIEMRVEVIDLHGVVSDAVDSVRESIEERRQHLSVSERSVPVWVSGDPVRLRQVVSNLLTNATKYTPSGGQITVHLDASDDQAVIRVSDTGQGISADQLTRVFDPFVQASPMSELRGGLGLGLTLVRKLVERHAGSVEVHSGGVGKGCEFTVRLPLSEPVAVADDDSSPRDSECPQRKLKILIAEDNQDSAEAMRALLGMWGHFVETAYDGLAAIECAKTLRPDVLLVDVDLPKKNGFEVVQTLSPMEPSGVEQLFIAVTGFGRREDVERTLAAGFHHHLVKPVNSAELRRILSEYSSQRTTYGSLDDAASGTS